MDGGGFLGVFGALRKRGKGFLGGVAKSGGQRRRPSKHRETGRAFANVPVTYDGGDVRRAGADAVERWGDFVGGWGEWRFL